MNNPSSAAPACQSRPDREHHRKNNAIPPAYDFVVSSAASRPNRRCRKNASAAGTTASSSSSTVQYPAPDGIFTLNARTRDPPIPRTRHEQLPATSTAPKEHSRKTLLRVAFPHVTHQAQGPLEKLSFGPFVSDYTRYLPANTSGRRLFWGIYAGNVLATFFSCAVGAYLAALLPSLGPVAAIGKVSGSWALVIMAVSLVNANTFNAYTGSFQIPAFGSMWRRFKAESVAVRLVPFVCVMAAGVVTAYLGYRSFVTNLSNFLDVLLVIFIPWSAVNLADYFLVRRGRYDVASFFTADGAYGRFAWRGLLAYAVGLGAEWPFVSQPDYTGPLVKSLGGADISWLVGWFAAAIVYLLLVALIPGAARHDRPIAATAR
jgi:hypothetical protein